MIHRHLEADPGAAPFEWGLAALDDLLDRGDLGDWRPILRAVADDPSGPVGERVLCLCDANPRQGTSRLWRAWIEGRRSSAASGLAGLRARRGLTQARLAAEIGCSQSDLSKIERREDLKLSTLNAVVEGLGMRLRVAAVDPVTGEAVEIAIRRR